MEPAQAPPPAPVPPEPGLLATWPRCVQVAVGVLLALGIGFLLGRSFAPGAAPREISDPPSVENPAARAESPAPRLDLNRATRAELALLPGVGPSRARSVTDYRDLHGPFKSVEDLRKIPGIGPKTLEKFRAYLFVDDDAMPVRDPAPPAAAPPMQSAADAAPKTKKADGLTTLININRADAAELQKLPGIGAKMAQRILDERTLRGPFKTIDELRRVPGIGPKTLEKLRPYVVVKPPVAVAGS
jgi:competence protein ComEA